MGQNGRYGRLDQRDFNQTRGMSNNQEQRVQSKVADNARSLDTRSSNATSHENADGSHGRGHKGEREWKANTRLGGDSQDKFYPIIVMIILM